MLQDYNQGTTIIDLNPASFHSILKDDSPQSGLHFHFVFNATTEIDSFSQDQREKFYRFIANCVQVLNGNVETIGGKNQSVHLLVSLKITQNPADFVRKVKLLSSSWAQRNLNLKNFSWREEEVFTVSESQRNYLSQSIQRQSKTFFTKKISLSH